MDKQPIMLAGTPASGRRTTLAALSGQAGEVDLRLAGTPECDDGFVKHAAAVVFVVDPRRSRFAANQRALQSLAGTLERAGRAPELVPVVFQLNKLDLPLDGSGARMFAQITGSDAPAPQLVRAPVSVLRQKLSWPRCDYVETIASEGIGVRQALARAIELAADVIER